MKGKKSKEYKRTGLKKWIENRKKKNQRKYIMTKPSFKKIFAKYLAVGLCVALVIGYLGTIASVSYYCDMKENSFDSNYNQLSSYIKESYYDVYTKYPETLEKKEAIWKSLLTFKINLLSRIGNGVSMIHNEDRNEILSEVDDVVSIWLIVDKNTDDSRGYAYHCDVNMIEEAVDDYNMYWDVIDTNGDRVMDGYESVSLEIKDIFVANEAYLPGQVQLVGYNALGQSEVLKEYDYTPKNVNDYEHIVVEGEESKSIMGPFIWEEVNEKNQAWLKNYVERKEESIWDYTNGSEGRTTFWGCQFLAYHDVEVDKDLTVKLIMGNEFDMFDEYGLWIILSYVGVLVITLMIVGMVSYRTYMVRLNHYQLDTYRRETTNAMAHDLKTPLTAISGYAENLRNNVHSEKKDYYADIILEHVQYMNEMVGNILELAKVENTNWMPHKESLDLKAETQDILKKYEILTADKNLTVSVEGERVIEADKVRMTQALENLIGNAMKYAANDTIIHIKLEKDFYEVRNRIDGAFEVSVEELWKPFIKGDNNRNEERGTGVGLTIVKNIADVHGFELVLQCEEQEFVAKILF